MHKPWKLGLPALLALACAPNPPAPAKIAALVQDHTGAFVPQVVTFQTITDAVGLQGAAADITSGARIVVDDNDPALQAAQTPQQILDAIIKDKGGAPTVSYVTKDDALWPTDFHSWNLATTYYNYEQAFLYWQQIPQVPSDELKGAQVYYWPSFSLDGSVEVDNALWFAPLQGFVVLPFDQLQTIPLPMNAGVIAHEYSHRIFNQRVYGGSPLPTALATWGDLTAAPGANVLTSIDEGLADYHAVGASCLSPYGCNPRFFQYSLDDATTNARDMSTNDKCMTPALRDAIEGQALGEFRGAALQYQAGTVFASALYHAGENAGKRDELEKAVVAAYSDTNPDTPGIAQQVNEAVTLNNPNLFSFGVVADAILSHLAGDPDLQTEVCNQLLGHLQLNKYETLADGVTPVLGHCPSASQPDPSCPTISPSLP